MAMVYISLGSNINREKNIRQAEIELEKEFGILQFSPVYETEAVGFDGDDFYNSVVAFKTQQTVQQVVLTLKAIEDGFGRDRTQPKFSARVIDLDLLLYGDLILRTGDVHVPREEILYNAFVLKPLIDIAGELIHPEVRKSLQAIWDDSNLNNIKLEVVDLVRPSLSKII